MSKGRLRAAVLASARDRRTRSRVLVDRVAHGRPRRLRAGRTPV